jgi:hypothetical protein
MLITQRESSPLIEEIDMTHRRRHLLMLILGSATALTAGCTSSPGQRANADGTYCYRAGKSYRRGVTCTPSSIPTQQVEAAAKQFAAAADRLTVYVVRNRWADSKDVVRIESDSSPSVDTVPQSFVRLRLPAGRHSLTAIWPDGTSGLEIAGRDGEIVYVELVGVAWSWGSKYRLRVGEPAESRQRAERLRLVADAG